MEISILIFLFILSLIDILYRNKNWGMFPDTIAYFFPIFCLFMGNSIYGFTIMLIFSLMLYNMKFFSGFQDIKIMSGLGALIVFKIDLMILVSLILIIGLIFKFGVKFYDKKKNREHMIKIKEFPFIPVFLITYLIFEIIKVFI